MSVAKPKLHEDVELPPRRDAGRGADANAANPDRTLSLAEAAEILCISEALLTCILNQDIVPHHTVGEHRRILLRDVLAYKKDKERGQKVLNRMYARDQEMGLYPTKP